MDSSSSTTIGSLPGRMHRAIGGNCLVKMCER
jgi:hypothetical protein